MGPVIHFQNNAFDPLAEPKNSINLVFGYSVLAWLKSFAKDSFEMGEIVEEDHGWSTLASFEGKQYQVHGGHTSAEGVIEPDDEWILIINPIRSLKDKLLGRGKIDSKDPLCVFIRSKMEADSNFKILLVED